MEIQDSISIYVHWPFCKSKCPYCDFNSHVREKITADDWERAYLRELESYAPLIKGKKLRSIFFGGGTPSLAEPKVFAAIIEKLAKIASIDSATEITMEANPTSSEGKKFKEFAATGINRVSIGIQSLTDENLKFLGREHNAHEAMKTIEMAATNFINFSFDLIYTLPNQKLADWLKDLEMALTLANGHLSLYQLTIEKGTDFYKAFKAGVFTMPDDDASADFYIATLEAMRSAGYQRYEISNYATEGNQCVHNMVYWRYQDFIGIGPGAHGRYRDGGKTYATNDIYSPEAWLRLVHEKGMGIQMIESLSAEQIKREKIIMGMRLEEGIDISLIEETKYEDLIAMGLTEISKGRIRATDRGFLLLNSVIEALT